MNVFWELQKEATSQKQRCQIRWHPIIHWCLKFISSSAYDALRSSGIIILPSKCMLRDYSNWMTAKPGPRFSADVDRQLMKEAKIAEIPRV